MSTVTPAIASSMPIDAVLKLGPSYWGCVIAVVLYGVSITQGYIYFNRNNDAWRMKTFVGILLFLDTLTTVFIAQIFYHYLILNYGKPAALLRWTPIGNAHTAITVLITFIAQLFFARRIHSVNERAIGAPLIITLFALLGFTTGIVMIAQLINDPIVGNAGSAPKLITMSLSATAAIIANLVATVSMCYTLVSAWSELKQARSFLNALVFNLINRGVLVTFVQIMYLILFIIAPSKFWWLPLYITLSKIYVNTCLAMLNSRIIAPPRSSPKSFSTTIVGSDGADSAATFQFPQMKLPPPRLSPSIDLNRIRADHDIETARGRSQLSRSGFGDDDSLAGTVFRSGILGSPGKDTHFDPFEARRV